MTDAAFQAILLGFTSLLHLKSPKSTWIEVKIQHAS